MGQCGYFIADWVTSDDDEDEEFSDGMPDSDDESNPEIGTDEDDAAKSRLVPGLEPGEYGKMPPLFYTNSQKVAPNLEPKEESGKPAVNEDKEQPFNRPIRPPILPRDKFDGVDSDDETDEDELVAGNEDSDEDHPELVGEVEPDMNEEEDEFLEFSRRALGISNEQWNDIINDRKNRGGMPFQNSVVSATDPDLDHSFCTFHGNLAGIETTAETRFRSSSD